MLISSSRPFASAAVHPLAVPWTAAPNPSIAESCPQGILSWQMAASALRSLVEAKALALAVEGDRSPCRTQPMAKLWLGHGQSSPAWPWYGVQRAELVYLSAPGSAKVRPGTILDKSGAGLTVAVGDGALRLSGFLSAEGKAWDTMALPVSPGQQLPSLTPAQRRRSPRSKARSPSMNPPGSAAWLNSSRSVCPTTAVSLRAWAQSLPRLPWPYAPCWITLPQHFSTF
ncbi:MAG: hypothetical protein HC824_19655 [Synechococcales cyanobacterium RM1_1_8]|nr:hypothetical protein [Synechococcales cyanobacterium RM1_1_8]